MSWLHIVAIVSISFAVVSLLVIAIDLLAGHSQKMAIMNVVWPLTALYADPLALGTWLLDFALAFLFGIAFQYFSIKPMRNLSPAQGLWAALKADALSLTSWQVGMYGWMVFAIFVIFRHELAKTDPVFWFMMQIAMLAGFITAFPVNWWLIETGIKEKM